MSLRSAMLLLFLIVSSLACGYIMKPPDGDPRPEGWIPLGLNNIRVNRLVLSDGWLYACAGKDGLYRIKHPANAGDEWEFLGLDTLDVLDVFEAGVMDIVTSGDTLIVGIWSKNSGKPWPPGILRSEDGGKTWVRSDSGMVTEEGFASTATVVRLHKSPHNSQTLLAGGSRKYAVYISEDFGKSWSLLYEKPGRFSTLGINPLRENEIWAGGGTSFPMPILDRSLDGGQTWTETIVLAPDTILFEFAHELVFDPTNAGVKYSVLTRQVLKTNDNGATWMKSDTLERFLRDISINPSNVNELIVLGRENIHQTLDAGQTWIQTNQTPDGLSMRAIELDWKSRIYYVATYDITLSQGEVYAFHF